MNSNTAARTHCPDCGSVLLREQIANESHPDFDRDMIVCETHGSFGVVDHDSIDFDVRQARRFFGDEAAQLVANGWTINSAADHVQGACNVAICTHPSHDDEQHDESDEQADAGKSHRRFTVSIDILGDALSDFAEDEIAIMLQKLARKIGNDRMSDEDAWTLLDTNGNSYGSAKVEWVS